MAKKKNNIVTPVTNNAKALSLDVRKQMLFTICKTKAELKNWIRYHLGLDLPDCTVSRYADTNPLDMIWEIYDICVNKNNPDKISEILYVAGRGSGKCAQIGTQILEKSGPKNIEDIKVGDIVYTGWNWSRVKTTFDEGVKPGIKVSTRSQTKRTPFTYTGTPHHRLQAINEAGEVDWMYMDSLKEGDWLYKSSVSVNVNTESDQYSEGWLVGAICGDGNVCIVKDKANRVSFCSSDFDTLRFYSDLMYKRFGIKQKVKRNSKRSVTLTANHKPMIEWFKKYVEGELAYDKKLLTINHSYEFLAGFIAGLMDTDGYRDGIDLANKVLIEQIAQILNIFGVSTSINDTRREPRYSLFIEDMATYHSLSFKTKLPDYLMPLFSKYEDFSNHRDQMNEQYRFPKELIKPFIDTLNNKLKRKNGYICLPNGVRLRKAVPYTKTWTDSYESSFVYGYKLEALKEFFASLDMMEEVNKLDFILSGYFEQVSTLENGSYYFYDLEIDDDRHSYWSNGFISHNTLGVAVAELMVMLHDQRDVVHVGAILSQAKRCYQYQIGFMLNEKLKPILNGIAYTDELGDEIKIQEKANMEQSIFNLKDRYSGEFIKVTLEVLPCTLKSVNGPHVALVSVDEIDTVTGENLRAFKDIAGMLDSKRGREALRIGISTRKTRYGLMNQQIEEAEKADRTVRRWTALEFAQQCPDERSGTKETVGYVQQDDMIVISEDHFEKLDKQKQSEYFRNTFPGEGCMKCPMAAVCLGDAKKQTSTSKMLKPIKDPIKKTMENGPDWALSQLFNLKPSIEGIIYKEFEERLHVKNWNEMWKILTDKEYPGECTHDIFVKKCHQMGLSCYAGIDWGWSNPSTVVYFFVDSRENVFVVRCEGRTMINNPSWVQIIKSKWHHMYRCQLYFPDLANPGDAQTMKTEGLPCPTEQTKDTPGGIQIIKKWLRNMASPQPKMFFARETCAPIITEFGLYHFKTDAAGEVTDDPEKGDDHWLDALRYAMYALFGKNTMVMASSDMEAGVQLTDNQGNFSRQPSPAEFANARGIRFNTENLQEKSKLGQISNKKEIDDDEDGDSMGGSGAFLWSFFLTDDSDITKYRRKK